MGAIRAFETALPRTEIKGCLFHYGQAINRCVQHIGLQAQYRDAEPGDQLKKWVRRAASLSLSPEWIDLIMCGMKLLTMLQTFHMQLNFMTT